MPLSKWLPDSHIVSSGFQISWCGFQSVTRFCLEVNFKVMLFGAMGRSLLIFTLKMTTWQPYWTFGFPDSKFSVALNVKSKLEWHITCICKLNPSDFDWCSIAIHPLPTASCSYWAGILVDHLSTISSFVILCHVVCDMCFIPLDQSNCGVIDVAVCCTVILVVRLYHCKPGSLAVIDRQPPIGGTPHTTLT